jgi:hypothetical protein
MHAVLRVAYYERALNVVGAGPKAASDVLQSRVAMGTSSNSRQNSIWVVLARGSGANFGRVLGFVAKFAQGDGRSNTHCLRWRRPPSRRTDPSFRAIWTRPQRNPPTPHPSTPRKRRSRSAQSMRAGTMDVYLSSLANRTNEVMKCNDA